MILGSNGVPMGGGPGSIRRKRNSGDMDAVVCGTKTRTHVS